MELRNRVAVLQCLGKRKNSMDAKKPYRWNDRVGFTAHCFMILVKVEVNIMLIDLNERALSRDLSLCVIKAFRTSVQS